MSGGNIWHLSAGEKATSSIIYHPVKNQKKLMSHPGKNAELIDGETIVIL